MVDDVLSRDHGAALRAEGLREGQRPHQARVGGHALVGADAGAARAEHPDGVRLVDDEPGTGRGADLEQGAHRSPLAVHREHPVGDDERARCGPRGQRGGDGVDVAVRGDDDLRAGQPAGVDERGVVVGVGHDQGAGTGQGHDGCQVGGVARGEDECGRRAAQRRDRRLQLDVQVGGAGHQPRAGRAGTPRPCGGDGRLDHPRVPGQSQVVVRRQVEQGVVGRPWDRTAAQPVALALCRLLADPAVRLRCAGLVHGTDPGTPRA